MKTYNTYKLGTAALAAALVLGIGSCAHHRGYTSTPVQRTVRSVSAPASLAGKTLILTGTGGGRKTIHFTRAGIAKFRSNGISKTAEYSRSSTRSEAEVSLTADFASGPGSYYYLKFNQPQSGTYQLEEVTSSDGSSPNSVVGRGVFVIR